MFKDVILDAGELQVIHHVSSHISPSIINTLVAKILMPKVCNYIPLIYSNDLTSVGSPLKSKFSLIIGALQLKKTIESLY